MSLTRDPLAGLFVALTVVGVGAGLLLKGPLYDDPHALGLHTISLLGPFVGAMTFAVGACLLERLNRRSTVATVALFLVLCLPFVDLLASPIVHLDGDDSYRYSVYAHNMLEARTVWGGDGLLHDVPYYVDQPGYRYYLAATIAVLGGEHRGLQLFDMGVLLIGTLALLAALTRTGDRTVLVALSVFLLGASPYAAKNVLYGYTEWFTVLLFMLFVAQSLRARWIAATILIALVPFVRQNLLPVSVLLAGVLVLSTRRYWLAVPYLACLGLPLYHNLYYADRFQLLVTNRGAEVRLEGGLLAGALEVAGEALSKVPHYLGYHPEQDLSTIAIAVMFVPLGSGLVVWLLTRMRAPGRWLLLAVAAAAIGPTLVLGHGSYPRFVYVNLSVILLSYWVIRALPLRRRS